jgi:fatty acid desaturase
VHLPTKRVRTTPSPTKVKVGNYICDMKTSFATLLTVAFIVLKLTNYITWSWFWVFSPLWIALLLIVLLFGAAILLQRKQKPETVEQLKKRFKL